MSPALLFPETCAACGADLPPVGDPRRVRNATCDEICHQVWIAQIIAEVGETKIVTRAETGRRHQVPTRTILEHGLRGTDLADYPEVDDDEESEP